MIILGICGFEDITPSKNRHVYSVRTNTIEDLFRFSDRSIPLQFFPLHLIGHDSSAALIVDGEVVAVAAEERFSRVKHGFNLAGRTVLPRKAILGKNELTFAEHNVALLVRGRSENVSKGLEQRDAAVRVGTTGAITLVFTDNRLLLPTISKDVAEG